MPIRSTYNMLIIPPRGMDDFVVYVDEFGQDGGMGKFGVVLLFMPRRSTELLADLSARVIADVKTRNPEATKVKARDWSEAHRLELCDLIREQHWCVGADMREMSHPGWRQPDATRERLFERLEEDGHVVGLVRNDVQHLRDLFAKHHAYVDQFYDRFKGILQDVANDGIVVRTCEIIADNKIDPRLCKALAFNAFTWLSRRYDHYTDAMRAEVLDEFLRVRTASDQEEPNLLAVDSIAHWWGMTQIDEKHVPGGKAKYRAYLDRIRVGWKPPPILLKTPTPKADRQ